jgi:hypothetical protein
MSFRAKRRISGDGPFFHHEGREGSPPQPGKNIGTTDYTDFTEDTRLAPSYAGTTAHEPQDYTVVKELVTTKGTKSTKDLLARFLGFASQLR